MIVFDLCCANGHVFEGWFASSSEYDGQNERGLIICPDCASSHIFKAPMTPAVPAKGNRQKAAAQAATDVSSARIPPDVAKAIDALAKAQAKALQNSTWVGDRFADTSRAIHYGDREDVPIHGKATKDEAKSLAEEGIEVTPLPFPIVPPDDLN
ncbi:DUF1178 family protein [Altererythrobacter aquiaggeris]|uniref:DUF1178 family protein n=1 Tax=Aestuarierythrobacter aquiaggeris TaxID=1898396 RepID=UPI00301B50DB